MSRLFTVLLALSLGLTACASSKSDMSKRMDDSPETVEQVEALKRAVESSYDRERAMAERITAAEEANMQLRKEIDMLRSQVGAVRQEIEHSPIEVQQPVDTAKPRDIPNMYTQARDSYDYRRYEDAIEQFSEVLSVSPYGELADNAQYWIGECYFGLGKFNHALTEFTKVFAYAETEKADDAQLKVARCQIALGEQDRALNAFQKLLDEYPDSEYIDEARKEMRLLYGP